nr:immunoglobulin light chain junction region [Macaca mulatta]MOX78109.1 immunoglobulin light chain junction region [Macaca mulatta]MOX78395.1 immunoglobulin light chain junction region [Macaca mulatta]MOX79577.1 immunoglobulin light chain junction region [Macaca mulatta]MOX80097.1 immunoglobulin light chain junction region [Macaca mulatta]
DYYCQSSDNSLNGLF